MTTNHKCQLCDKYFSKGDMYDDLGCTYENGTKEHYFVHISCRENEMQRYRNSQNPKLAELRSLN